jgi:hypothetical protein
LTYEANTFSFSLSDVAMTTLVDLLSQTYTPIQGTILLCFDIVDILALGRTCKRLSIELSPALKATRYNINRHLRRFFDDPVEFRSLQGSYGGLVYGDFARCFLAGDTSKVMRLDIAADNPSNFHNYLTKEKYSEDDVMAHPRGIQVLYSKKLPGTSQELSICLDCMNGRAAIAGVFEVVSTTASLDIISWNRAYSLFPMATHIKKECYLVGEQHSDFELRGSLGSLSKEGLKTKTISWGCRPNHWNTQYYSLDELTRRRRISHKRTWVYNLDIAGVFQPIRPDGILESTTFRLRTCGSDWNDGFSFYHLDFDDSIRHPILKYPFVVMEEDEDFDEKSNTDPSRHELYRSNYGQMCIELKDHLNEQTMLELVKIPEAERPPQCQEYRASRDNAHELRNKFTPPSTWTYFDEDVILFLAEA